MNEEYHTGQGLTMADLGLSLDELAGQPMEVLAREGAKVMLTVALEEEVTAFLQRGRYERSQDDEAGNGLTWGNWWLLKVRPSDVFLHPP